MLLQIAVHQGVASVAVSSAETGGGGWTTPWLGVLLMVLGFCGPLERELRASARPVASALSHSRTEFSVIAPDSRNDLPFGRNASHRPAASETSF